MSSAMLKMLLGDHAESFLEAAQKAGEKVILFEERLRRIEEKLDTLLFICGESEPAGYLENKEEEKNVSSN